MFIDYNKLNKIADNHQQKLEHQLVKTESKNSLKSFSKANKIFKKIPKKCLKEAHKGNRKVIIDSYLYMIKDDGTTITYEQPAYWKYLIELCQTNYLQYSIEEYNDTKGDFLGFSIIYKTYKRLVILF